MSVVTPVLAQAVGLHPGDLVGALLAGLLTCVGVVLGYYAARRRIPAAGGEMLCLAACLSVIAVMVVYELAVIWS